MLNILEEEEEKKPYKNVEEKAFKLFANGAFITMYKIRNYNSNFFFFLSR